MDKARKPEPIDRHMTIPQTARRIGKANATIRSLVLRGELEADLVAGNIVIRRDSIDRYLARAPKRRREA